MSVAVGPVSGKLRDWMGDHSQDDEPQAELRLRLDSLRRAHQELDAAVQALEALPERDQLKIARLKKRKLVLRDQIVEIDDRLTPDIIA